MLRDEDIVVVQQPDLSASERSYLPQVADGLLTTLRHMVSKKRTVEYPEKRRVQRYENYRGVHRLNRDDQGRVKCVACFMCETICPAHCITIVAGEAPWPDREKYPITFEIDELKCIYCGMCEESCPVDAIELTPIYEPVGFSREEMIFDREKLLEVYDKTIDAKPADNPKIVGY